MQQTQEVGSETLEHTQNTQNTHTSNAFAGQTPRDAELLIVR